MKKYLLFLAAALTLAACAKSELSDEFNNNEITFQVARYSSLTTKAEDYKTDYQNVPFGAYSWYKGISASDNTGFMDNQKVSYQAANNLWAPEGITYYWPKTGTLDFICYSPYTADGTAAPAPTITESAISYPAWNVNTNRTVDVMYSDKAVGLSNNTTTYNYNGVPVLFHHALSRLVFACRLAYNDVTAATGDKTKWEVTISNITLKDVKTTGTLALDLNADGTTWKKPDSNVWTNNDAKADISLDVSNLTTFSSTTPQKVDSLLVLPQALNEGQKVELTLTIKTFRDTGTGYAQVLQETDIPVNGTLASGALTKWGINQNIIYTFILAPSRPSGKGVDLDGDGIEDQDPTIIYFDPAVQDWENVTVNAGINL